MLPAERRGYVVVTATRKMNNNSKQKASNSSRRAGVNKSKLASSNPQPLQNAAKAPVAQAKVYKTNRPKIQSLKNGDIIITHREFVIDVNGSAAFSATSLPIAPGRNRTFPWLSNIANNYESYKFKKLKFEFLTSSSTTKTGRVMLAVDYDARDPKPISKTEVMAWRNSVSCAPWEFCAHASDQEDLTKRKTYYVRQNPAASADAQLSDVGVFYFCTQGQNNGDIIGELYADYEIHLMTPALNNLNVGLSYSLVVTGTSIASVDIARGNLDLTLTTIDNPLLGTVKLNFQQDFMGTIGLILRGTTLGFSTTHTANDFGSIETTQNAADTETTALYRINVARGQSVTFLVNYATLTAIQFWIMQGQAYPA